MVCFEVLDLSLADEWFNPVELDVIKKQAELNICKAVRSDHYHARRTSRGLRHRQEVTHAVK